MVPLLDPFEASGEKTFIFRKTLWLFSSVKLGRNENRSINNNENTPKNPFMCWPQALYPSYQPCMRQTRTICLSRGAAKGAEQLHT